ncbi:hypothetical protein [Anaeromyxobacter oryzisoli]|uniref:hypothetical protein n=1 Tax=Anaeromyxobacter oryzisoli TaxID=2925408 RepID=UPI001F5A3175|nr:hypothetical protein [Anaeromyxobacter sp. SG63]
MDENRSQRGRCAKGCGCGSAQVRRARWIIVLLLLGLAAAAPFVARPDDPGRAGSAWNLR